MAETRVDKWLWAVRVFKTRTIASDACKNNKVSIDDVTVKPSRSIKVGDMIKVRKKSVTFHYKVVGLISKRVGAKLVEQFMQDVTPESELEKLEMERFNLKLAREKGEGRPTKKDRRDLESFFSPD